VNPKAVVRLVELDKFKKNAMTSGIEPATFRLIYTLFINSSSSLITFIDTFPCKPLIVLVELHSCQEQT
jgi:hypothetical protein